MVWRYVLEFLSINLLNPFVSEPSHDAKSGLVKDTKEYSKKRIQLFNKRINGSHSSFINYFKNRGEDVILQSSMNTKLSPLEISYNAKKLRNAILN